MQTRSLEISTAVEGTCQWLVEHKTYKNWAASDRGLLWIKGKPGAGKSTLMKYALNHQLKDLGNSDTVVLSFFFHGRGDTLQKNALGLFRSLLHQLLDQAPDGLSDLVHIFDTKREKYGQPGVAWHWHEKELWLALVSSLPKVLKTRSVCCFVDALDECGKDTAVELVEKFKAAVEGLRHQPTGLSQFRICFSCRHYPIVDLDQAVFEICAEEENPRDISTFVEDQLAPFAARTSSAIPALITERASGVFMWARLVVKQVQDLEREGEGLQSIEAAVQAIPPELDDLYRQLIRDMGPASLKLIQWICFAERPLTIDEIRWAMVIEGDCPYQSLRACESDPNFVSDSDRMKRQVQTLSRGLAEVIHVEDHEFIQFIHQSVKDFFVERGLMMLDASCSTRTEAAIAAHFRLAKICIRYLAIAKVHEENWRNFVFLKYAAYSLGKHLHQCDAQSATHDEILKLFTWPSNDLVESWVFASRQAWAYKPFLELAPGSSLLHIIARYGTLGLLSTILKRADQMMVDIDSKDEDGRTALLWASMVGNAAAASLLLSTGKVDINTRETHNRHTPLIWAAQNGHEAVVKHLLSTGQANIRATGLGGRTALLWAVHNQDVSIVNLLLETENAGVEMRETWRHKGGEIGITALGWAARAGNEAIVKLLLEKGKANIQARQGILEDTALILAAENGHESVVEMLFKLWRPGIEVANIVQATPLIAAVKNGHCSVANFLLDVAQADTNAKDFEGKTPLHFAVLNHQTDMVRLLLNFDGVDINAEDNEGLTALWYAARSGHEPIARLLINHDIGPRALDFKNKTGQTLFFAAAQSRNEGVIHLLHSTSKIDPGIRDKHGNTALMVAARESTRAVVLSLLSIGNFDVDLRNHEGRTALSWAAEGGNEAIVRLLLKIGKNDIDAKDDNSRTAFSWAVGKTRLEVSKFLASTGNVDVDSRDNTGRTPLSWACDSINSDRVIMVEFLLSTGKVDVDAKDDAGRAPLSWAAGRGDERAVELLLNTGNVEIDAADDTGRTPLSWAFGGCRKNTSKQLLATGKADPNTRDSVRGRTPLMWAKTHPRFCPSFAELLEQRKIPTLPFKV